MLFQAYERVGSFSIEPQRQIMGKDGQTISNISVRFKPITLWPGGPTVIDTNTLTDIQIQELQKIWPDQVKEVVRVTEKKEKDGSITKETVPETVVESRWKASFEKWLLAHPRKWKVVEKLPARKVTVSVSSDQLEALDKAGVSYSVPGGRPKVIHGPRSVGSKTA